jgi:hypothetical protein
MDATVNETKPLLQQPFRRIQQRIHARSRRCSRGCSETVADRSHLDVTTDAITVRPSPSS